jgi:hypothetical protein
VVGQGLASDAAEACCETPLSQTPCSRSLLWHVDMQALRWQTRLSMFVLMLHLVDMFNLSPSLTNVTTAVSARAATLLQVSLTAPLWFSGTRSTADSVSGGSPSAVPCSKRARGRKEAGSMHVVRTDACHQCRQTTPDLGAGARPVCLLPCAWRGIR